MRSPVKSAGLFFCMEATQQFAYPRKKAPAKK